MTQVNVESPTLPTHPDGSGDLMGIYGAMFGQCSEKSEVRIVEGSLKTLHSLLQQPCVAQALDKGARVQILYTGPEPSNDEEKIMYQDINCFITQRTISSLSPNERMELIQRDMFEVYQKRGVDGLARHLTLTLQKDGRTIDYDSARQIAQGFEQDVQAKRIAY